MRTNKYYQIINALTQNDQFTIRFSLFNIYVIRKWEQKVVDEILFCESYRINNGTANFKSGSEQDKFL